jgi:hypothetical protein
MFPTKTEIRAVEFCIKLGKRVGPTRGDAQGAALMADTVGGVAASWGDRSRNPGAQDGRRQQHG